MSGRPVTAVDAFQARETFHVAAQRGGQGRTVTAGEWIAADDPIVRTHRAFLVPVSELVERTTAAPGEVRNVHIPRKDVS